MILRYVRETWWYWIVICGIASILFYGFDDTSPWFLVLSFGAGASGLFGVVTLIAWAAKKLKELIDAVVAGAP